MRNGGRPKDDRRFVDCQLTPCDAQLEATMYPERCEPRTARIALPKKPNAMIALKAMIVKRRVIVWSPPD